MASTSSVDTMRFGSLQITEQTEARWCQAGSHRVWRQVKTLFCCIYVPDSLSISFFLCDLAYSLTAYRSKSHWANRAIVTSARASSPLWSLQPTTLKKKYMLPTTCIIHHLFTRTSCTSAFYLLVVIAGYGGYRMHPSFLLKQFFELHSLYPRKSVFHLSPLCIFFLLLMYTLF
jgi:hypothetical protein